MVLEECDVDDAPVFWWDLFGIGVVSVATRPLHMATMLHSLSYTQGLPLLQREGLSWY